MQNLTCPNNPSFNIIYSKIVTCCFSTILEQKVKDTFTYIPPVVLAASCVALACFMCVIDQLPKNPGNPETHSLTGRANHPPKTSTVLAIGNFVAAVLLFGCAVACAVTSFRYAATMPGWVQRDLNRCICETPQR